MIKTASVLTLDGGPTDHAKPAYESTGHGQQIGRTRHQIDPGWALNHHLENVHSVKPCIGNSTRLG